MRIVSYSLFVPYVGIPHAGGEYYRRHVRTLRALGHDVTIVAPRTGMNEEGLRRTDEPERVLLVDPSGSRGARIADRIAALLLPHELPPSQRRAILRTAAVRAAVAEADLIEAHWAELWFAVRDAADALPTMLYAHDVPLQRELRWLRTAWEQRRPRKVLWRAWRSTMAALTRARSSDAADVLVVLSAKDAKLAHRSPRLRPPVSIDPPLWPPSEVPASEHAPPGRAARAAPSAEGPAPAPTALFVAAFHRRENVEAATWLLNDVWGRVLNLVPDARLVIAGAHPPPALHEAAGAHPDVVVTGYVAYLESVYAMSDVVVVPLRAGAGVKFKTIDAMLRDLPVVSTTIGAEGIVDDSGRAPFPVADGAGEFAAAVAEALRPEPGAADSRTAAVGAWARDRYGEGRYGEHLRRMLAEAQSAHGATRRTHR